MSYKSLQLLIPLICFFINISAQLLSNRMFTSLGLLKSELVGLIVGFVSILIFEVSIASVTQLSSWDWIAVFISNIIIYISLTYCYFHFINLAITARRIRLLRDISCFEDGLTMDEILIRYNSKDMISNRINRLLDSGQIILNDGRYFIGKPIMLLISKVIVVMKLLLLGKRSEFDR